MSLIDVKALILRSWSSSEWHSATIRDWDTVYGLYRALYLKVWLCSHLWCPAAMIQCLIARAEGWYTEPAENRVWQRGLLSQITFLSLSQLDCFHLSNVLVVNCLNYSGPCPHMGTGISFNSSSITACLQFLFTAVDVTTSLYVYYTTLCVQIRNMFFI